MYLLFRTILPIQIYFFFYVFKRSCFKPLRLFNPPFSMEIVLLLLRAMSSNIEYSFWFHMLQLPIHSLCYQSGTEPGKSFRGGGSSFSGQCYIFHINVIGNQIVQKYQLFCFSHGVSWTFDQPMNPSLLQC